MAKPFKETPILRGSTTHREGSRIFSAKVRKNGSGKVSIKN